MDRSDFALKVLAAVRRVPAGRVATYGDIATRAGRPRAWRAVGNILRSCHDPHTPCHRVVASGGALGGYGGNLQLKRELLRREGVDVGSARVRRFRDVRVKVSVVLLAACLTSACGNLATGAAPAADARVSDTALMAIVTELSSPPYQGRLAGSAGGRAARAFVKEEFEKAGLTPAGTDRYEQPFRFGGQEGANLIGRVPGTTPAADALVVSAHYDHRGIRDGRVQPGADDNASGVAALVVIARHVKASPLRRPVYFVAFDAEELGLAGAKAFVAQPPVPLARVAMNLNLDMLSRSDRNEIYAAGTSHAPWLRPLLAEVQRRSAVTIRLGHDTPGPNGERMEDWTLQSDHAPFHEAGVPFLYYGVESHADYHRHTDTADKIDPVFFRNVVSTVLETILVLDRALEEAPTR